MTKILEMIEKHRLAIKMLINKSPLDDIAKETGCSKQYIKILKESDIVKEQIKENRKSLN